MRLSQSLSKFFLKLLNFFSLIFRKYSKRKRENEKMCRANLSVSATKKAKNNFFLIRGESREKKKKKQKILTNFNKKNFFLLFKNKDQNMKKKRTK
jgi:hypothetical protein